MAVGIIFVYDTVAATSELQVKTDGVSLTSFSFSLATGLVTAAAMAAATLTLAEFDKGVADHITWLTESIRLFQPALVKNRNIEVKLAKNYNSNMANSEWDIQGAEEIFSLTYRKNTGKITTTPRSGFTLPVGDDLRFARLLELFAQLCHDL